MELIGEPFVAASVLDWVTGSAIRIWDVIIKGTAFFLWIAGGFLLGKALRYIYGRIRRDAAPTSGQLLAGKTLMITAVLVGIGFGLNSVFAVDIWSLFATVGILSIALGFGLQNTVANLAAGVSLSLDKPFEVGDRIQVGETWGDVVTISLRSTRIITTSGQHVIIPNSVMDTQEVWNSTHDSRRLRMEVPFSISYDSSIPLAESLALKIARGNPAIMAYPEPVVRVRSLGDNAIQMELRAWLERAQDRAAVVDQVLRGIKAQFDDNGVLIPYPQRTISYTTDIPEAAPTPEHLLGHASQLPTVLVCTRTLAGARAMADTVLKFVEGINARIIVLNVRHAHQAMETREAEAAVNLYLAKARKLGVPAHGRLEIGQLAHVAARVAREEGAKLVLLGRTRKLNFHTRWQLREVDDIKKLAPVPVLVLNTDQKIDPEFVYHWHTEIHPKPIELEEDEAGETATAEEEE